MSISRDIRFGFKAGHIGKNGMNLSQFPSQNALISNLKKNRNWAKRANLDRFKTKSDIYVYIPRHVPFIFPITDAKLWENGPNDTKIDTSRTFYDQLSVDFVSSISTIITRQDNTSSNAPHFPIWRKFGSCPIWQAPIRDVLWCLTSYSSNCGSCCEIEFQLPQTAAKLARSPLIETRHSWLHSDSVRQPGI